jgi:hypothetical protein
MTLYAIKRQSDGLYLCDGQWGEEPEWFEANEAVAILQTSSVALRAEAHEFSARECGVCQ